MLSTNLQAKFGLVRDVRPVLDPWGLGVTFEIRRIDSPAYQEWVKKRQRESPIFAAMLAAQGKALLKAAASGRKAIDAEDVKEAMLAQAERVEFKPEDFEKLGAKAVEGTALLLAGWSGLLDAKEKPEPFSYAAAVELLSGAEWVPEGMPYGGQTLGAALSAFVLEEAAKSEAFRQAYLEGAAGN